MQACHGIVWLAQHHHLAVGQPHGLFDIGDDRFALCGEAGNGNVLKLPAIGLVGKIQHLVARNRCPFRLVAGRPGQPQKQGDGIFAGKWRSASAVLHMAGLAGSGVIERPQPVRGLRGGGGRHPELLEQRIAELEILFSLKRHCCGWMRKRAAIGFMGAGRCPAGHGLEGLRHGKIHRRRGDSLNAALVFFRQIVTKRRGKHHRCHKAGCPGEEERLADPRQR
ncbi:hypothetical protein D3C87_1453070 [compost metagenome]